MRYFMIKIFGCVFLSVPRLSLAHTYDSIEYNVDFSKIKNAILTIEMTLKGTFKDKLVLILPSSAVDQDYAEQFKYIAVSPQYNLDFIRENKQNRAIIILPNKLTTSIKLLYEVHQKQGNPLNIYEAVI